ncbi:hypothetical protein [uncultured Kordia sp.]|uniref:hypothetical protein n=1 Tax=uncultured Kordia sp. TaxID=507699 RepID=UPI002619A84F|nr:hypothetical protein [uncultured Kordia sp.]
MKKIKSITYLTLLLLINLSLFNCSKDGDIQEVTLDDSGLESIKNYLAVEANNSALEANKIDVVIFDQFKPLIKEGFDLSNHEDKVQLLNNLPYDLLVKAKDLRDYFALVRKNKVAISDGTFSTKIEETITSVKAELIESRVNDLNISNYSQPESCSYTSIIIGYYYNYWRGVSMPIYSTTYACTTNRVVFYEGNNYTGDILFTLSAGANRRVDFTQYNAYDNDEARSIKFWHFSPGQVVTVYDRSDGGTSDDYTVFTFLSGVDTVEQASTFERNFSSSDYSQVYRYGGNLDGKVSSVRFSGN